jgi:hypothetical protein
MSIEAINPNVRCDAGDGIKSANFRHIKDALSELSDAVGGGSGSEREVVEWFGSGTKDTAVDGEFSAADSGAVYFSGRYGPADIGITHDPTVASPIANGNFTVTESANYLVQMTAFFGPLLTGGAATDYSIARMRLDLNRAASGFVAATALAQVTSISQYPAKVSIHGEYFTASTSFVVALLAADVLRLVVTETRDGAFGGGWQLSEARIIFDKISDYDEFDAIP